MRRLLLALLLASCAKAPAPALPDAGPDLSCATRADCLAKGEEHRGEICSAEGRCGPCASDGQCALRERCEPEGRRCVFRPGWGEECALNAECAAGQLCVQGLCAPEAAATFCSAGRCLAEGQRCNRDTGVCEEDLGCLEDADCSALEVCNVPTHACVLACTPETREQVCALGQKCVDRRCTDCEDSADCPGGMVCDRDRLACVVDGSLRCLSDRDCAAGLVCNRAAGFCAPAPPPCLSSEVCLADERCDVATGKCVRRACQPDRLEPNASAAEARPVAEGELPGLTLCGGEEDWYAIPLARGERFDVFVETDVIPHDVFQAQILDATGRVLAEGALAVEWTASTPGTYLLRLEAEDAFVEYGLRLAVGRGTPCDEDRFEPNDEPAAAATLTAPGDWVGLTLCGRERDLFRVEVPAGRGLRVERHSEPSAGPADLVVWALDGTTVLGQSAQSAAVQVVVVPAATIAGPGVLLGVLALDGRAPAEYQLSLELGDGATP